MAKSGGATRRSRRDGGTNAGADNKMHGKVSRPISGHRYNNSGVSSFMCLDELVNLDITDTDMSPR